MVLNCQKLDSTEKISQCLQKIDDDWNETTKKLLEMSIWEQNTLVLFNNYIFSKELSNISS